jgi:hypothetical protein
LGAGLSALMSFIFRICTFEHKHISMW